MKDYLKKYKKQICLTAAVCLLGTAAFCGFHIYHHYAQVEEQTEAFEQIAEVVEEAPESEPASGDTPVSEGEDVLAKYRELYLQNEDMVGWIAIDGTKLNYPVMQTKNNPNFYLKRNFEKEYSDLGVPYIERICINRQVSILQELRYMFAIHGIGSISSFVNQMWIISIVIAATENSALLRCRNMDINGF